MQRTRTARTWWRTGLALGLAASNACARDDLATNPFDFSTTKDFVVGEAANAVGDDGKFEFPLEVTTPPNEVSREIAQRIAVGYVRTFGRSHVGRWQHEVNHTIGLDALQVCDRAHYAQSAYTIPAEAPKEIRRQFGNRWVMSLCDAQGTPTVALSFSPEATSLTPDIAASGGAVPDAYFFSAGIPARVRRPVPLAPEAAVSEASRFAALRIKSVPVLVRPAHPMSDLLSRWRTTLEAEVALVSRSAGSGAPSALFDEVFVGFGETFGATGILAAMTPSESSTLTVKDALGRDWVLPMRDPRNLDWVRRGAVP